MRAPIKLPQLSPEAIAELDQSYRSTRAIPPRLRARIVLLAAEQDMLVSKIAKIVRGDEETVHSWFIGYLAEGVAGLADAPRPGAEPKVTPEYRELLE